jgi:hypothetical protein
LLLSGATAPTPLNAPAGFSHIPFHVERSVRLRSSFIAAAALALLTTTAFAQQPAAPAPKPPLPNRLNSVLPTWLRVRGEFRERVEGFENSGFNETRDDVYYLSRFRFNVATTSKYFGTTVQLQDARVGQKTVGPTGTPFTAKFDLRQAFADIGSAKSPVVARVGRQELAFGDQRLIGHLNWTNAARTFDAARVTFKSKAAQVDLFGASIVRIMDGEFDKSGNGHRLAGAYVSSGKVVPKGTVEPYVLWRRDQNQRPEIGTAADLKQVTTGVRLAGRMPAALDYNVEMDVQRGSLATDDIKAWAGHWQLRATLPGTKTPHVTGEYNYASGDSNPADGIRGTFDQLYPTGHDKYGLADQVGWRNIHDVRLGVDVTPFKATPITLNYHSYWLAEKRDGLYNAGGALLARVAAGAASAKVGQEIDLQIARPITPQLALAAGYSHLFAGPFLKEATPGKSYSGPFLMLTYVFLAER